MDFRSIADRPAARIRALVCLLLAVIVAPVAVADAYSEQWGPAVGSQLPVLEAYDQAGEPRTLDNLAGERGLLLIMSRSADW